MFLPTQVMLSVSLDGSSGRIRKYRAEAITSGA
jgi:hypothetical protein